jgi:menaquinone reductase, iron-sulfur cluster-binding subunit
MTIDLDRCTGCGGCVVACRTENNVPYFGSSEEARGTEIYWMELLPVSRDGSQEKANGDMLPLPCMHCDNAPCVKVCPTNATYQTDDGIVAQIWDRCIGCRYCQVACPYGRRYFNWTEPEWPDAYKSFLNPDVATRPMGIIEKCTLCHHRVRAIHEQTRLEGRRPTDDELKRLPACAQVCPAEAITFGNLNDAESEVSRLSGSPRAFRLLEHVGTRPKVTYLAKDRRRP